MEKFTRNLFDKITRTEADSLRDKRSKVHRELIELFQQSVFNIFMGTTRITFYIGDEKFYLQIWKDMSKHSFRLQSNGNCMKINMEDNDWGDPKISFEDEFSDEQINLLYRKMMER